MIADTIFAEMHRWQSTRAVRRRLVPLTIGGLAVLLFAEPVAAQTGIDMLRDGVCGTQGGQLIVAAWAGFVLFLVAEGIFHFVMGLRKAGKVDPSKTKEGREEAKGSGLYFLGAMIVFSAERVFAFLGIPFLDCIRLTFGV